MSYDAADLLGNGQGRKAGKIMQLSGFKTRCVGKRSREWDNGDVNYEVQLSNGLGGIMVAGCSKSQYDSIVPLDVVYDVEINVDTNGYKHYIQLVSIGE